MHGKHLALKLGTSNDMRDPSRQMNALRLTGFAIIP